MELVIASRNAGKIKEIRTLLADTDVTILSLDDVPDMPEVIEDGDTFLDNALKKARETCIFTGRAALADDSGLEVDALDGAPGVHSARYAPTTTERNEKLLAELEDIPEQFRTARFICCIALVRPDGFEWTTTAAAEGVILHEPRGDGGFGYDPIFLFPLLGRSFAELSPAEKNTVSHRGKAMAAFAHAVKTANILQ